MPKHRLLKHLILSLATSTAVGNVWAIGLGAGPAGVALGQTLDFAVSVRLDGDEALSADCVQAEVFLGDQRVAPTAVRTRVVPGGPGSATIRVSTTSAIDEPVVAVQLTAGCGARVNRRYVVFADPVVSAPTVQMAATPISLPVVDAPANLFNVAANGQNATPAQDGSAPNPQGPVATAVLAAPVRASLRAPQATQFAAARTTPTKSKPVAPEAQRKAAKVVALKAAAQPVPQALVAERPRLRLEVAEPAALPPNTALIEEAFEAVAQAASAARTAAATASASAERIATLERSVEAARSQAQTSQNELVRLRAELARPTNSSAWLWPLLVLAAIAVFSAGWLAWRLRAMRQAQEAAWLRASTLVGTAVDEPLAETSPLPLITSALTVQPELSTTPLATTPPDTAGATSKVALAAPLGSSEPLFVHAMARTVVLPPSARVDDTAPRDVSIEELIDVDQQAEFFIALGQDTAAIDLLVTHLRNTGGGSPLTYLKLLEIYRRRGDQAAYERTRSRFNQRYNAYAPEWGVDLTLGKSLEDYPDVAPRLQLAWSRPLDAMAELEALLFRKSRGELFDLPAYREVLFLYSLARDMNERDSVDQSHVDLLLPLDGSQLSAGLVGNSRASSDLSFDDHPTAPVDLELTPPEARESIFGELLAPTSGSMRRR